MGRRLTKIGCIGALSLLLLVSSDSVSALEIIPKQASEWQRLYVRTVRQVWGLSAPSWLAAQVHQESGWRDGLTSSAGAKGMCQFMPSTAAGIESQYEGLANWGRYSPRWCFYAQALLMRDLYNEYKEGRTNCNGIKFAGSAYNGGPKHLNREIEMCKEDETCIPRLWTSNVEDQNSRAGWAYKENRDYVNKVTGRESLYAAAGWGIPYCKG